MKLHIGNKNVSSWSMRPWLVMRHAGLAFEEVLVPLDQPGTAAALAKVSPSGRVPALHLDDGRGGPLILWDSLAIAEWANETCPQAQLWPSDATARAVARCVTAEMHSGFGALREELSMYIQAKVPARPRSAQTQRDIARIQAIWADCRARFGQGGPFLFGRFSIADAFYAPVVMRFRTYSVPLDATAQAYCAAVLEHPAVRAWVAAAEAETIDTPHHAKPS